MDRKLRAGTGAMHRAKDFKGSLRRALHDLVWLRPGGKGVFSVAAKRLTPAANEKTGAVGDRTPQ